MIEGTVMAALIASFVTLVGLIISKENKTSEFQQNWIDELRQDLSGLIGNFEAVVQTYRAADKDIEEHGGSLTRTAMMDMVRPEILAAETVYVKVLLRLNPVEHNTLIERIEELRQSVIDNTPDEDVAHKLEQNLVVESQRVLKKEWRVVKSGETTFRATKLISGIIVLIMLIVLAVNSIDGSTEKPDSVNKSMQSTANASYVHTQHR